MQNCANLLGKKSASAVLNAFPSLVLTQMAIKVDEGYIGNAQILLLLCVAFPKSSPTSENFPLLSMGGDRDTLHRTVVSHLSEAFRFGRCYAYKRRGR